MSGVITWRPAQEVLTEGSELLRLLAAVVDAHLLDDEDGERIDTLLSQVTSSACRGVADELDLLKLAAERHARERAQAAQRRLDEHYRRHLPPEDPTGEEPADPPRDGLAPVVPLDHWRPSA